MGEKTRRQLQQSALVRAVMAKMERFSGEGGGDECQPFGTMGRN